MTRFKLPLDVEWRRRPCCSRGVPTNAATSSPSAEDYGAFWGEYAAPHGNVIQPWRVTNVGQVLNAL